MVSEIALIQQKLRAGELSVVELVKDYFTAIDQWEPHIHALIEPLLDEAVRQAEEQDEMIKKDQAGPLAGVPVAIKDLICTQEGHTRAASKILENFCSPYDATVVSRLKKAGAIIIGKANMDEFAMGSSTEYSAYGSTYNPWDVTRVAGGSSGGSAAAVASGEAVAALGSDTGGSIRQPASFCHVVGLKPTYGRVSRFGVIAYASSFDQAGPLARLVKDCALMTEVIAGHDPLDATSSATKVLPYSKACGRSIKGKVIGVPREFFGPEVNGNVATVIREALRELEKLGAKIKEVSLPLMSMAVPTYYLLVKSEASTNLARFDALRYGSLALRGENLHDRYLEARGKYFGSEVKRSILMGTYALSAGYIDAWYKKASRVRTLIRDEFTQLFKEVDVIAGPVSSEPAFKLGSKVDDPLAMYLADLLTDPPSVAGLPALSVPAGFVYPERNREARGKEDKNGLPVGLQLIAPPFQEDLLFQVGFAFEQATEWHKQTPKLPV